MVGTNFCIVQGLKWGNGCYLPLYSLPKWTGLGWPGEWSVKKKERKKERIWSSQLVSCKEPRNKEY